MSVKTKRSASSQDDKTPRVSHRKSPTTTTTTTNSDAYLTETDFSHAADVMSTSFSSAIHKLNSFLHQPESEVDVNHVVAKPKAKKISRRGRKGDCVEENKEESLPTGSDDLTAALKAFDRGLRMTAEVSSPARSSTFQPIESPSCSTTRLAKAGKPQTSRNDRSPYHLSSPMARMRDSDTQREPVMVEGGGSAESTPNRKVHKTQEQMKTDKQRKWKRQMKLAQEKKRQEQKELESDETEEAITGRGLMDLLISNVFQMQCGGTEDVISDSDYSSAGEESGAESTGSESSSRRSKKVKSTPDRRRKTPKRSSPRESVKVTPERKSKKQINSRPLKRTPVRKRSSNPIPDSTPSGSECSAESDGLGSILSPNSLSPNAKSRLTAATDESYFLSTQMPPETLAFPPHESPEGARRGPASSDVWHSASEPPNEPLATIDPKNTNFVKLFIHDIMSSGCSVLWHKEEASMNPSTVLLFLKPGYRMPNGAYCGPRLVWSDRKTSGTFGINLFDILSLERANPVHLGEYPFAMPGRSIFLKMTKGREFVFEAKSEKGAFRFLHGMRWVIARLTFNLVIGNIDVSCELLDIGVTKNMTKNIGTETHKSLFEEARWARAMDDLTDQLVEKSVFQV